MQIVHLILNLETIQVVGAAIKWHAREWCVRTGVSVGSIKAGYILNCTDSIWRNGQRRLVVTDSPLTSNKV